MPSSSRPPGRLGVAFVAAPLALLSLGLGSLGCERVSFWSSEPGPEGAAGPSTGVVGSTVAGVSVSAGTGIVIATDAAAVLRGVSVCAIDLYDRFVLDATALTTATEAFASSGTSDDRDRAREAWRVAIGTWQQAEVLRVGPAGPATLPEGRSLRDEIYSWPLVSRCLVEQTLVSRAYEQADFIDSSLVNVRGLAAAEYLLFHEGTDNACSASSSINATGSWAAIAPAELASRKARYAAVVVRDVESRARALSEAWREEGGAFGASLASAGRKGSSFESEQAALNAISDGLFYLEKEVKDLKLGKPLGVVDCDESACLDDVESRFARHSVRHVENNLRGFQIFFSGCEAGGDIGFDDLLATAGAGDLGASMQAHARAALGAAEAIEEGDLASLIVTDRPKAEALHAAVKLVTDDLKTDMVSVLDLEPPATVEGDND